jgi:hypothetical protein
VQPEWIVGFAVAAAVIVWAVSQLLPKRKPPSLAFTCARCHKTTRHNNRTEEAWRNGSKKLFCNSCHELWLRSRPPQPELQSRGVSSSRSGCLGVVALLALLPLGIMLVWVCA